MHRVSKDGLQPSNLNLKAIAECMLPQTYTKVHAFLGLVGHYCRFIKRLICFAVPLSKHLAGEGASRKSECVSLSENAVKAFEALKTGMHDSSHFVDYTKPFLLETDASKGGLGKCYHRSRQIGFTTLSTMAAGSLCLMRRTTTQLSLNS